jgi:uncharacterized membrane protein
VVAAFLLVCGCARRESEHVDTNTQPPPPPVAADTVTYVARGNEPFWALEVTPSEVVFREPENIDGVRGAYASPTRAGARLIFRTTLRDSAATPVELTLDERPCQDSMSGFAFAYTATARIGERMLQGCGEQRPATPRGEWTVIGHQIPGISAMGDAEAAAWHGRAAFYSSALAVFGADTCRSPSYLSRQVRGDSLLTVDYRVAPGVFGLKPGATIRRIEVQCSGSAWSAPGGTLLEMPNGSLFTVWDGVFFELRRSASAPSP